MSRNVFGRRASAALLAFGVLAIAAAAAGVPAARAQAFDLGPDACQNCHKAEFDVWQKTKHATSFNDFHRLPKVRDVLKVTGDRSPKQSKVCVT